MKSKMDKSDLNYSIFPIYNENIKLFLSPYGASIHKLYTKTKEGEFKNIAFSFAQKEDYRNNPFYAGATLAPAAGRIEDGILSFRGKTYHLTKNENQKNHLHGGCQNLSFSNWELLEQKANYASFCAFLKDKTDGYPGNRSFFVSYEIIENGIKICQRADSDIETYFNLSNHTYFNLNSFSSSGLDQFLKINASAVLYNNEIHIPQKAYPVKNSAFDFRYPNHIAERLKQYHQNEQLLCAKGYNHYFLLDPITKDSQLSLACSLFSGDHCIQMDLYTDAPSIVLYTGGFLNSAFSFQKNDDSTASAYPGCAIAIEPSYLPFHHICQNASKHFERTIHLTFSTKPKHREN